MSDGHGRHRAKKQFGQHFLHERRYIELIVHAIDPKPGQRVAEIGPGLGAITKPLMEKLGQLTVIELDRDVIAPLTAKVESLGELDVRLADVLSVDFSTIANGQPLRLVGNLPYNISSPILFHALAHRQAIQDMHFMLQKEVVDRMAAAPGSKVYGRLSVMLQAYCRIEALFDVPPGAFSPPPKVDSAVVRLIPRAEADIGIDDHDRFASLVKAAFAQRRKTLRNTLRDIATPEQMEAVNINPAARAEAIAVTDYVRLSNTL
ncbi:MAG: 16S rRNA (adenine(1518)-N(6)/adenine(1519)-N(6))-dimethyltransferase RsmA [Xanthomonadales bacterium]|nr:16S rRNA (adenine(1518)-N(6)/adenine(1519)-N(6))-dimethyltransferase RsmA [Xanthomonadales bacterium]